MTDPLLQEYYYELETLYRSSELRSLPNNDRRHNATILCFMLDSSKEVNLFCGEMSIFREQFYAHIEKDWEGVGVSLKKDIISALKSFLSRDGVKLNIIVQNYNDSISHDLVSHQIFREGINAGKISIRKLNQVAATDSLTHSVYTEKKLVRIEENLEEHSGMFLTNMSDVLFEKFKSNYKYLQLSSDPITIAV